MERVTGIEPVYSAWKADVLAIVLYPLGCLLAAERILRVLPIVKP